jgi:hypothetical protein
VVFHPETELPGFIYFQADTTDCRLVHRIRASFVCEGDADG